MSNVNLALHSLRARHVAPPLIVTGVVIEAVGLGHNLQFGAWSSGTHAAAATCTAAFTFNHITAQSSATTHH